MLLKNIFSIFIVVSISLPTLGQQDTYSVGVLYDSFNATGGEPVFYNLSEGRVVSKSEHWHFSYTKYVGFKTNSGSSGIESVKSCLVHEYPDLFDEVGNARPSEFLSLNESNTLNNFLMIEYPDCKYWQQDSVKPFLKVANSNVWIVRSTNTDDLGHENFARIRLIVGDSENKEAELKRIRLIAERWNANGHFEAPKTSSWFEVGTQKIFWDLESNEMTTSNHWELSFEWLNDELDILINENGHAAVGIVKLDEGAEAVTDPTDQYQVFRYFKDSVKGGLSEPGNQGPLNYNTFGARQMLPTFSTYLIKDGVRVFKLQILNSYGEHNTQLSGHIYFRYEEI